MKLINPILAALMAVAPFSSQLVARDLYKDISQLNKPATIKVLIAKQNKDALLEVKGRYSLYNPVDGVLVDSGILGKRSHIKASESGIKWGSLIPDGLNQFRLVPGDSQSAILLDGIQYLGCIEAYQDRDSLLLINEVDVESYLKATLAPQFSSEKNVEFLDAIAITARTNTYFMIAHNQNALWHVDAKEVGYQGLALSNQNPRLDRSIENTRHMVMTYQDSPFAAMWTKDSAGKTANPTKIFRKDTKSPDGVQIPIALRDREKRSWSLTVTKEQIAKIAGLKNVNAVDLFRDQASGKVYAVRVHDGFTTKDVDFFSLQNEIGAKKLRSNDFSLNLKKDNILITGFGDGPGIGLCLYSARIMAEHGDSATKILSTFFPQTSLERKRELR